MIAILSRALMLALDQRPLSLILTLSLIPTTVVGAFVSDGARDLKDIVDGLLNPPPSASLGKFPTS